MFSTEGMSDAHKSNYYTALMNLFSR